MASTNSSADSPRETASLLATLVNAAVVALLAADMWKEVCKIYPHEFVYTWVLKSHENDSVHLMSMPDNRNWPEVRIRIKIPVQDDPTCTFRLSAPMKLEALWACFPNTHHNHFRTKLEPLGVEVVGRAPIPEEQLKSILLTAFPDTPHRHVHW